MRVFLKWLLAVLIVMLMLNTVYDNGVSDGRLLETKYILEQVKAHGWVCSVVLK